MDHLLTLDQLVVRFAKGKAVDGATLSIKEGELMALVGESGSGKSMTAMSLLGLLPPVAQVTSGHASFQENDLLHCTPERLNELRGKQIGMIFQEPMTALNPVLTIGYQIGEVLHQHEHLSGKPLKQRILSLLAEVGIPDPSRRIDEYPHQLSGGMRQRVVIAMAIACRPKLLIADEPTTALDVTVQAQIMQLLRELRKKWNTAVLLITHNLALVRNEADSVAVIYAGKIVEQGTAKQIFQNPMHPYTRMLQQSIPQTAVRHQPLLSIPGQPPGLISDQHPACAFAPRCPLADEQCRTDSCPSITISEEHFCLCRKAGQPLFPNAMFPKRVGFNTETQSHKENSGIATRECCDSTDRKVPGETTATAALENTPAPCKESRTLRLKAENLQVLFSGHSLWGRPAAKIHAVDTVNLELHAGETLALVGESGCGKTTVGKALIRLVSPTSGTILVPDRELKLGDRAIQMIFQDPFSSLDPRLTIRESLSEGLDSYGIARGKERLPYLKQILEKVGLSEGALELYPHQFSGGQRQRIGLARALAVKPKILICDECTSALDVSVQAQILNLLQSLQKELQLAILFITHDLSVVSYLADRVAVMYLGHIVEQAPAEELFRHPLHPYTQALLAAAPQWKNQSGEKQPLLAGEIPSPAHLPSGCRFHTRCPMATEPCEMDPTPDLWEMTPGHWIRCPFVSRENPISDSDISR